MVNTGVMFRVEAPAKFILTLQSMPPFFVENIFALTLVVLLTVPLIAHIQFFLSNVRKVAPIEAPNKREYDVDEKRQEYRNRTVVMHYPAPVKLDTSSNSDLNIQLTSMRTTCSTPTVKPSSGKLQIDITKGNQEINNQEQQYQQIFRDILLTKQKKCLPLDRSSSFLATNAQLPIIDISSFDYDSYRHKLIDISLKRQYGDRQAPGDVVLNSIHLNCVGSQSGIQLSDKYSHNLFDFIEEYYDITKILSKKEKEYLHPLDHFLVKGEEKPETSNTGTGTGDCYIADLEQIPEIVTSRHDQSLASSALTGSPMPSEICKSPKTAKDVSRLAIKSRTSSLMPRTQSHASHTTANPSVTGNRNSLLIPTTQQLFSRTNKLQSTEKLCSSASVFPQTDKSQKLKKTLPISRTPRSRTPAETASTPAPKVTPKTPKSLEIPECNKTFGIVNEKSSNDSILTPSERIKYNKYPEAALSTDQEDKESVTCPSLSCSEVESSCNSSKPHEKRFVRTGRPLTSFTRNRTIRTPSPITNQLCVSNANRTEVSLDNQNAKILKKSSEKVFKSKLGVRPKSTVGRFTWDVPDVPEQNSSESKTLEEKLPNVAANITRRPRTSDTLSNDKRRNVEKNSKLPNDIVPAVLKSFVDLQDNLSSEDNVNSIATENEHKSRVATKPSPEIRETRRIGGRSRDRSKVVNESFVKLPATRQVAIEKTDVSVRSKSGRANSSGLPVAGMKSSSITKTPVNGSVGKLQPNEAVDRTKTKNSINENNNPENSVEKRESHLDKTGRSTKRTGYYQIRKSSLVRKIETTPEDSQLTANTNSNDT